MSLLRVGLIQMQVEESKERNLWELLFRCWALDNQVFAIGVAPARDERAAYVS